MTDFLANLQRKLILVLIAVVISMLISQFLILGFVGTIGPELSNVRIEQEKLRLESEILTAQIRDLQTTDQVSQNVIEDLGMKEVPIENIYISESNNENLTNELQGLNLNESQQ